MSQRPPMVLDSNVFIEPKNRFYSFDICPGFWDFMAESFANGNAMSITHVRDEILAGNDELSTWMKDNLDKVYFHDCTVDDKVSPMHPHISSYVRGAYTKPNVIEDFLRPGVADPWIVAYALAYGGTVVTQEKSRSVNRKVSLIDVCDHFDIHHIDIIEFLREEKARFIYKKVTLSSTQQSILPPPIAPSE